ncbi:MAG: hypothetical protein IKM83_06410 [Paludibacteraceae bacterium]|nr:hypothetical protein [Paludibacteraceae bacterium]
MKVTNTTITNISTLTGSVIDLRNKGNVVDGTDSLLVDHVTIYNWTGGDNGAIMGYKTKHIGIYNTIIAQPSSGTYGVYCYGGYVKNILANNVTHKDWSPRPTYVNAMTGDPLFVDAANGNYALSPTSPAIGAALDGSNLGDPRWNAPSKYASTDFSTPYAFTGDKAGVGGYVWRHADGYLYYNDKEVCGTAIWGIHATKACAVKVQLNMNTATTTGHKFKVYLIDVKQNKIDSVAEKDQTSEGGNIDLKGTMYLPKEGDYFIKLYNLTGYSSSKINGVTLSYAGGAVQNMPATTNINEAWFSPEGTRADSKIDFPDGTIQDGWVKWNVAFANAANYKVTVNIDNANGHNYTVGLYANDKALTPVVSVTEGSQKSTIGKLDLGSMEVPAGNYIMKVTNAIQWSDAKLVSVKFESQGGGVVEIPNANIPFTEVMLSPNAYVDGGNLYFIDYDHRGHIAEEYAKWNIHAENDGVYQFTANGNSTTGWSNLKITITDSEDHEVFSDQTTSSYHGEQVITFKSAFLVAGNYVVQLENPTNHSHGYISSFSATAATDVFIVDENETDASVIAGKDATSWKALLKRTFKGGVYNSFCIPVEPSSSEMTNAFGAGYELLELESATLEGSVLMLNFIPATSILAGKPYLLKPVADVANPVFNAHNIHNYTTNNTVHKEAADFIGTFIKQDIDADPNNLYLGTDNKLYFSNNDVTIKGLRAYFHVNISNAQQVIKHARIMKGTQVLTDVELVETENNAVKSIENGQLIITIDGVRYNVMGAKIQ